jgi:LEA14-like dessication related protein
MPETKAHITVTERQAMGPLILIGGVYATYLIYNHFFASKIKHLEKGAAIKEQSLLMKTWIPKVTLYKDSLLIDLKVENPNSVPMQIDAIIGDVTIYSNNGKSKFNLGLVKKYGRTIIKPVNETNLPISIHLKTLPMITYFSALINGKINGQILVFDGALNINGDPFPFKTQYKIA